MLKSYLYVLYGSYRKKGTGDLHEEKEYCDAHDNGNDYIWTSTSDVNFVSGKKHDLLLLVGKDVVQGGVITARPWGEETIIEKETD